MAEPFLCGVRILDLDRLFVAQDGTGHLTFNCGHTEHWTQAQAEARRKAAPYRVDRILEGAISCRKCAAATDERAIEAERKLKDATEYGDLMRKELVATQARLKAVEGAAQKSAAGWMHFLMDTAQSYAKLPNGSRHLVIGQEVVAGLYKGPLAQRIHDRWKAVVEQEEAMHRDAMHGVIWCASPRRDEDRAAVLGWQWGSEVPNPCATPEEAQVDRIRRSMDMLTKRVSKLEAVQFVNSIKAPKPPAPRRSWWQRLFCGCPS